MLVVRRLHARGWATARLEGQAARGREQLGPVRQRALPCVPTTVCHADGPVDQPAGTGFSYVTKHDDVRELAEAAEQGESTRPRFLS